jgi:hypothetical protein
MGRLTIDPGQCKMIIIIALNLDSEIDLGPSLGRGSG